MKKGRWLASIFGQSSNNLMPFKAQIPLNALGGWSVGQDVLVDFVIEKELGEGGMGKVYLLKSQTTNRRFAVKRSKRLSDQDRRNFLSELQAWIDLPEHPNLVPCRFFRTVADEVLIFAEYVDGGSLKDWIVSGKLYEGGKEKALDRMIHIAIQFAWGLHCVHELGIIHQDVKPANIMMATDAEVTVHGIRARVTDYGLARALRADTNNEKAISPNIHASSGGFTPAYCSPEQFRGEHLDRRTDIWSWGLSVLEMFQGEVTWHSGTVAPNALQAFIEQNGKNTWIPAMPEELTVLLKCCFNIDLATRWDSLDLVLEWLQSIYLYDVGKKYCHELPAIDLRSILQDDAHLRQTRDGGMWTNPQEWLIKAVKASGINAKNVTKVATREVHSRRGWLVADLALFEEAIGIYENLIKKGRNDFEAELSILYGDAALMHLTADNTSEASSLLKKGIYILERLVSKEGRGDLASNLAGLYNNNANAERRIGNRASALAMYDQAINLREGLDDYTAEAADKLALLFLNKGALLSEVNGCSAAEECFDKSIETYEGLVYIDEFNEYCFQLAISYQNKASCLIKRGLNPDAISLLDRALDLLRLTPAVDQVRRDDDGLAKLYTNKAKALRNLADVTSAVDVYQSALDIYERLVIANGRTEFSHRMAIVFSEKADAILSLGDKTAAIALYDRAINIYERLVNIENRIELVSDLALLYRHKEGSCGILDGKYGVLSVSHEEIISGDISPLTRGLNNFLRSREEVVSGRGRLALSICGYDSDPRDVWEINEVREYLRKLDSAFPYWFYFAHPRFSTLKVLLASLCSFEIVARRVVPNDDEIRHFIYQHGSALNTLCANFNISDAIKKEVTDIALEQLFGQQ